MSDLHPRLPDLTARLARDKALQQTADRLALIALREAPALARVKAAVPGIGVADVGFTADPEAQPLVQELQRRTVAGALLAAGAPALPPHQLVPIESGADPEGTWLAEGAAVPYARVSSTTAALEDTGYLSMLSYSRDLLRIGGDRARRYVLGRTLRSLRRTDDRAVLGTSGATAGQPAGLLAGVSAVGSGSPSTLSDDFELLVAETSAGEIVAPVFAVSPRGAAYLLASDLSAFRSLTLVGGTIGGAPCVVTPQAGNRLVLIDAAYVGVYDGAFDIRVSEQAAVEMLDGSLQGDAATGTGAQLVSAFQTGQAVLRVARYLSWLRLRADAANYITLSADGSPS